MPDDALKWFQVTFGQGAWHADTPFGRYNVWQAAGTCWMHPPGAHRGMPGSPDLDAAKAIAAQHYAEALRIRAHDDALAALPEPRN